MTIQEYTYDDIEIIIDSIATGAKSPDEIIASLDKPNIEWYVTGEGALAIKYWQFYEGFVHPEHAATIRSSNATPEQGEEIDWLSKNLQQIRRDFGGKWVAILDHQIAASAMSLPELLDKINELDTPLVTFITDEPIVWTFTYVI